MKHLILAPSLLAFLFSACQRSSTQPSTPTPGPSLDVTVTTIAGQYGISDHIDATGSAARFENPTKLSYDPRNQTLYVADHTSIRAIDAQNNVTTCIAQGTLNAFDDIRDIDLAPGQPGSLYLTTKYNTLYRMEHNANGYSLSVLTQGEGNGDGPLSNNDHLDGAYGIASLGNNDIALYNTYWTSLKKIHLDASTPATGPITGTVTAWAGKPTKQVLGESWPYQDGQGLEATFSSHIYDICADGMGNIYLPDRDISRIRKVSPAGNVTSLLPYVDADGDYLMAKIEADGVGQVAASQAGDAIFFTALIGQTGNSSSLIRRITPGQGVISIAGFHDGHADGSGKDAAFGDIAGLAVTPDGKTIYVSEDYNRIIRKITIR